jgi:uncharacterized repeat protein (TIGR03803 family)
MKGLSGCWLAVFFVVGLASIPSFAQSVNVTTWHNLLLGMVSNASAQTFTVLHAFTGQPNDGARPWAGVVLDSAGNLYGTTYNGGTYNLGTVFKVAASGAETLLYSMPESGGPGPPQAGLVRDARGNLFGTTRKGGRNQDGAVFRVSNSGKEQVLYDFVYGPNGSEPLADLVLDRGGNLYGTTWSGGNANCQGFDFCGVVFKLSKSGKYTVLHRFSGPDGAYPLAGVTLDEEGNLYGTTSVGGSGPCKIFKGASMGCGTVFRLDRKGKLTVLHSFTGGSDGQCPSGDLVRDASGNLYGTTFGNLPGPDCDFGPPHQQYGTVFKIDKHGKETVLHNFTYNGTDGTYPEAGLVRDAEGNLYGTTSGGGSAGGGGTMFKSKTVPHPAPT